MTTSKTSFKQSAAHQRDKQFLLVLLGLNLLLLAATLSTYFLTKTILAREKQKIFEQDAEKIQQWVEERMLAHVTTLRYLQVFWNRNPEGINQKRFKLYLDSVNVFYDYPAISSVAFVKKEGGKYVNTLIEPEEIKQQALGFDHGTIPLRKQFFDRARDEGEIISTDPFELITTKRSGMFLIAPVYVGGTIPVSVVERQEKLLGFIIMVFRDTNLFTAIFGRQNPLPDVDFAIYHERVEAEHRLFDSDPEFEPDDSKLLQTKKYVTVGNTPWTIFISAKPSFSLNAAEEKLPLIILTTGLAFTTALAGLNLYFFSQHWTHWH